ncbi:MAG: ABC transporter ATP-binding protein [Hoeflea sp.]|uniref:ABC transporter ATP-binding protein n=1 Tax=Hoeflea sp. TaxID=1940281 RepID=UPI0032EAC7AD
MSVLSVRNLETYYGAIAALRGVSIDVEQGEIVTILGANGAGKSTLMKTIIGLMEPEKGQITFMDKPIGGLDPDRVVRQGVSLVPEGREVFPYLTIEENLKLGGFTRKDNLAKDIDLVYTYFPILKERRKQVAGYLSGGQQQMLAIGRGLMSEPRLLMLDEPSLGLSPLLTQEIFGIISRLNTKEGVTMLLVEQNAHMALETAHRGYVLEMGRIVMTGNCVDLMASDDIQEFYLGKTGDTQRGQKRWKRRKTWR